MGSPDPGTLVALYRRALPQVYGYLLPRCGSVVVAEDLTAEARWNRMTLLVADLASTADSLRRNQVVFRHDIQPGVGVRTLLVEDPSGNPIELFEPIRAEARLEGS